MGVINAILPLLLISSSMSFKVGTICFYHSGLIVLCFQRPGGEVLKKGCKATVTAGSGLATGMNFMRLQVCLNNVFDAYRIKYLA
jgi:hypothetical protein